MNTAICSAIASRSVVQFYYDGGVRIVEPHCHGISTADNEVLRGFQVSGYSQSGQPHAWKLFDVAKISGFTLLGQTFDMNRPGYNPDDSAMSMVHCHV